MSIHLSKTDRQVALALLAAAGVLIVWLLGELHSPTPPPANGPAGAPVAGSKPGSPAEPVPPAPAVNPIEQMLRPPPGVSRHDGLAIAVLIDTSGSMSATVRDADGKPRPKIQIAQRAVVEIVRQAEKFDKAHPDRPVMLAVYDFSERGKSPSCRKVIGLSRPNASAAETAVSAMVAAGNTPIGDAMIAAKKALDASGLTRQHILVVTDGENNRGYAPDNVTEVLAGLPEERRAAVYFVAFDVATGKFNAVRDAGGLVMAASNETELRETLDYVLMGKILAEKPDPRR